ncbi:hypothetical protein A2U01_0039291, partial [Trifolium medium]|nr:hypothetical protein [Trifolium medium]
SYAYGTLVLSSTSLKSIPEYTCSYQFTVSNFSVGIWPGWLHSNTWALVEVTRLSEGYKLEY